MGIRIRIETFVKKYVLHITNEKMIILKNLSKKREV